MILSGNTLRHLKFITPFNERTVFNGMSYGVSYAGYDIRVVNDHVLYPGEFTLVTSVEYFDVPKDVLGVVHDKSTWARLGLAVQNTVLEPGWKGYLTLELTNHHNDQRIIKNGSPIAQIVFHKIDDMINGSYEGKYQNQEQTPVAAKFENN